MSFDCGGQKEDRTSKLASWMRRSMSNLEFKAWCLIIATVRVTELGGDADIRIRQEESKQEKGTAYWETRSRD
jgi:hypothetical protein